MSEQIICPLCKQPTDGNTSVTGNQVCSNPNCLIKEFGIRTANEQEEYAKTFKWATLKKVTQPTEGKPSIWK